MDSMNATRLFFRADGSLMVAMGDQALEIFLTPAQLVALGFQALRLAVHLDAAGCLPAVTAEMGELRIPVPIEDLPECRLQ